MVKIRREMLHAYIGALRLSFGPTRAPIDDTELEAFYKARDYNSIVRFVRDTLKLNLRIRVGLWNGNTPADIGDAPAWINRPMPLPMRGTRDFKNTLIMVNFRKSFLQEATFEQVVLAVAHELSHVVLDSVGHVLSRHEEAVDLTAMLLGFRDFYTTGCRTVTQSATSTHVCRLGYLKSEEVRYAAHLMTFGEPPPGF
mgnify:CR=1 FL=1